LARYIYEWKQTEHGRRLFRRPGSGPRPARTVVTTTAEPDLSTLKKDELIELADKQGVDTAGTKADIIERLSDE
jgi:hypothetical protein